MIKDCDHVRKRFYTYQTHKYTASFTHAHTHSLTDPKQHHKPTGIPLRFVFTVYLKVSALSWANLVCSNMPTCDLFC